MQTSRDQQITQWIGELGAANAAQIARRFGMGRSWCYQRLHSLARDRLLEEHRLLHQQPGLYAATPDGLRWAGLGRLGTFRVSPGSFEHITQIAHVAAELHHTLPGTEIIGERVLRTLEADEKMLVGSIRVGQLPGGRPALHRPDLMIQNDGKAWAVEVELSVKAPRRLEVICRGYARARHIHHTIYLATPAAGRAVTRAIQEVRAADRITVLGLADLQTLARLVGA
jgi:hypothetical protein